MDRRRDARTISSSSIRFINLIGHITCGEFMGDEYTTIRLKNTTRNRLLEKGKKGESYDDIINFLMDADPSI